MLHFGPYHTLLATSAQSTRGVMYHGLDISGNMHSGKIQDPGRLVAGVCVSVSESVSLGMRGFGASVVDGRQSDDESGGWNVQMR